MVCGSSHDVGSPHGAALRLPALPDRSGPVGRGASGEIDFGDVDSGETGFGETGFGEIARPRDRRESMAPLEEPAAASILPADVVRVFWIELDVGDEAAERLAAVLDAGERERAGRFHFRRDAVRYIAGRARLRMLLAGVLQTDPSDLAFAYGERGKPELGPPFDGSGVCFNLSHSERIGVLAVCWGRRVGVDVERVRPLPDLESIADRTFSLRERLALRCVPVDDRESAFFRCWTRKEAFIKGLGHGLSHPLDAFSVTLGAGEPARLIDTGVPGEADGWTLESLAAPPGYVAALAIEGPPLRVVAERAEDRE